MLLALALALGCAEPLGVQAWEAAVVDCELDGASDVWADGVPLELSAGCQGRLIADFGMDMEPEWRTAAMGGVWALAAGDLGTVAQVRRSNLVSAEFVRQLERQGRPGDPVAAVLYSMAAHRIDQTVDGSDRSDGEAWFEPTTGTMGIRELGLRNALGTPWMADVFVHEMWHADGWVHVPCPGSDARACDRTLDGPYGAAVGFLSLAATRTDSVYSADSLELRAWEFRARVLP